MIDIKELESQLTNRYWMGEEKFADIIAPFIAELRKDAERLDYVLCNGRPLKHEFMYRYQCRGTMNWHDDPRDAIDAAREADKLIASNTSAQEVG